MPLLLATKAIDSRTQLRMMLQVLGTPSPVVLQELNPQGTLYNMQWSGYIGSGFQGVRATLAKDLLNRVVKFSPSNRLNPFSVCAHPYFDVLRFPGKTLPNGKGLPELFNFKDIELMHMNNDAFMRLSPNTATEPSTSSW